MKMKIKVIEIGRGICKDENGNFYVGIENGICQNMETGEIYQITERNGKDSVIEIKS